VGDDTVTLRSATAPTPESDLTSSPPPEHAQDAPVLPPVPVEHAVDIPCTGSVYRAWRQAGWEQLALGMGVGAWMLYYLQ
jgi:hypothetical protein